MNELIFIVIVVLYALNKFNKLILNDKRKDQEEMIKIIKKSLEQTYADLKIEKI